MASTSSIPSNEIEEVEDNTNHNQNQGPEKVKGEENEEKPVSKSLTQEPNEKKASTFKKLIKFIMPRKSEPKVNKPNNPADEASEMKREREAITNSISADMKSISKACTRIENHKKNFTEAEKKFKELKDAEADPKDLREFKKVVKSLKQHISTIDKEDPKEVEKDIKKLADQLHLISLANKQEANAVQLGMMPNLFADFNFERTLHFQDFMVQYNELPIELKLCLLCFSVFPEDVEIKRRVMVYWWIGEEFVPPRTDTIDKRYWDKFGHLRDKSPQGNSVTPEYWANFFFLILLDMGFIESAQKTPNPKVDTCRMHPFVRNMVNRIAQKANFLEFDGDGTVNEEFSKSLRACLLKQKKLTENNELLGKIHAVFNVDEEIIQLKHDSLANMRNANVLYLGRWQSSGTHHIEIDDTKILNAKSGDVLDGLQDIKNLKFLSFQGISRIKDLPKSILKLSNLTILDIRACHNLETLPDKIGCLVNLTHLDMSECYLLDKMPKGIGLLRKLQVLGGFVVLGTDQDKDKKACTLDDLKGFSDLRKLSIHTGSDKFPSENDLAALNKFPALSKLTIAWGRGSANAEKEKKIANQQQNPRKENQETISKEADKKEVDLKGKGAVQSQEIEEKPQKLASENVNVHNPHGASTSKNAMNKDNEKNEAQSRLEAPKKSKGVVIGKLERNPSMLPRHLTKLDLQCLPETPLTWLKPDKLPGLKKLYIRGGRLSDLGQFLDFTVTERFDKPKWNEVEELRLKYLDELEMEWRELLELFPKLEYLEKVDCPKLSFFPCDDIGVWTKDKIMCDLIPTFEVIDDV